METVDWAGVDVLVTDLELPGASGVALIARARAASPRLLALPLTVHDEAEVLYAAIEAGATGYVLKGDGPAAMLRSIHDVVHGWSPISPAIGHHLIKAFRRPTLDGGTSDLSARELEILALVPQRVRQAPCEPPLRGPAEGSAPGPPRKANAVTVAARRRPQVAKA